LGISIGSKVGTTPGGVGTGFFVGGLKTLGRNKSGVGVGGLKTLGRNNTGVGKVGFTGFLVEGFGDGFGDGFFMGILNVGFGDGFFLGILIVGLVIGLSTGPVFGSGREKIGWSIINAENKMVLRMIDMALQGMQIKIMSCRIFILGIKECQRIH
jgi:hypothetical protein